MKFEDYNFNKECKHFLTEIEEDYSNDIEIVPLDLGVGNHGFSKIKNGIPTIEINNDYHGDTEGLIIHEAYHLSLRFDGCPDISFESSPDVVLTQQNKDYLFWFYHKSWDKIIHHYFYPNIKNDLNLNPYIDFENELRTYIDQKQIPGLNAATKNITLGCYYLQTWVETQNNDLLREFGTFLDSNYQGAGIELGADMIQLFKRNPLNSIKDFVPLFIKIFNICHLGHAQIKLNGNETENMGNYNQNNSVFSMWKA